MFDEVKREDKIYIKVLKQFQNLLRSPNLKPGDKLPPEREMARMFNVSRPALKQALTILEAQDIIECRQGDGNYVLPMSRNIFNPIVMDFYVNQGNMDDILEFRYLLEVQMIKIVALKITSKEELSGLYETVEQMQNFQPIDVRSELNNKFHYELVMLGGNTLVTAIYDSILDLIGKQIYSTKGEHFKDDHMKIIDAILSNDPSFAANVMRDHLEAKFPNYKYYKWLA